MTQKYRFLKSTGFGLMLIAMVLSVSSCIDQLYNLGNGVSMDMELGGDSLAIPIGSTDTIMLGNYLDSKTISMLKTMEDGGYAITMKDSIEPNIDPIDQSKLKIDDQTKIISTPIDFGDINLEDFKIPGLSVNKDISLNFGNQETVSLPISFSGGITKSAGISNFSLDKFIIEDIAPVNTSQGNFFSGIPDPPSGQSGDIQINDTTIDVDAVGTISSNITVPDEITSIKDVKMQTGKMSVTIELEGASGALTDGFLVPNFSITPEHLLTFKNSPYTDSIKFTNTDQLTKANQYKVTKEADIDNLIISNLPNGTSLPISGKMNIAGHMTLQDAVVNSANFTAFKNIRMLVTIALNNMVIGSMVLNISTQNIEARSTTLLSINNKIPDQIDSIKNITFTDNSEIKIVVKGNDMPPINSKIESLYIKFPKEFVFDASTLNITLEDGFPVYRLPQAVSFDPTNINGYPIVLRLAELKLNKGISNSSMLDWSSNIEYRGNFSFGGEINSSTLHPEGALSINFTSNMTFNSAEVKTKTISVPELKVGIPLDFTTTISTMVKHIGFIKLKDNTQIRLDINRPEGLPLSLSADNFRLQFPTFFAFNSTKNPPMVGNVLTLNGAIPDSVVLYLDGLTFDDDLINGVLSLSDSVKISGKLALVPGWVNSAQISTITDKNMSVKASTSDLRISQTNILLNNLSFPYKDSVSLKFDIPNVPKQLVSLDSVLLKDSAAVELAVNITNMPDFGSPINVDLIIDFPDLLILKPGTVNAKNQLIIHEQISADGKLNRTIGIRGLKFDGNDLNGILKIDKQLKYDASVSVVSPNVNSDDLVGKVINIGVEAKITNIAFKSVYGKLDPGLDPIDQTISLESIPAAFKDENFVLDITKPVIEITTECNLGIPIDASVKVTPIRGGSSVLADEQAFTLKLPKAPTAQDLIRKTFWISPDSAGMPTGSDFIKTNVQNLFKNIPDGVKLVASINTDKTMQHFIDLTANYKFKLGYEVTIPLAFGEDLNIEIKQDITGLDPKIGEMAKIVGGIALLGTIQNSIPLELELAVIPLDANSNRLAIDTVKQIISAGAHDGSAVASALTLKLSDPNGLLKDLRGFRLIFTASSNETVAGTPIKPENFVKADLKVRVDGGINIKNLMNK